MMLCIFFWVSRILELSILYKNQTSPSKKLSVTNFISFRVFLYFKTCPLAAHGQVWSHFTSLRQAAVGRYSLVHRQHGQRHHLVLGTPTFQPAQRLHATCTGETVSVFAYENMKLCWEWWEWPRFMKHSETWKWLSRCRLLEKDNDMYTYQNSSFSSFMLVVESLCALSVFNRF